MNLRRLQSLLFLAFAFGAILFTASTLLNELRVRSIDEDVAASTTNGLPGVQLLSGMAIDAEATDDALREYSARPDPARLREQLTSAENGLADKLRSYSALPGYPGERVLKSDLAAKVDGLASAANALLASLASGDEGTRLAAAQQVHSFAAQVRKSSLRLIAVNNDQLAASTARISRIRATSERDALTLDGIAMLFALGTAAMAVRGIRRYAILNREHTELMQRRAVELEQFGERLVHDLRNPLGAASMCIDRIKESGAVSADPRVHEIATRADRSLRRALSLMNGIFAFARSAGKLEPGAATDVGTTVRNIVDELSISKDAEGAVIDVEPFPRLFVACDVVTLTSMLENLLQNALKYTRDCEVRRITVRASPAAGKVRVEIEDTGPGIPQGVIDRIFEPYVRVGGGQQVGLGLGLATVKRFCEACGGSVRVRSTVGQGSTFTVELPEASAEAIALNRGARVPLEKSAPSRAIEEKRFNN